MPDIEIRVVHQTPLERGPAYKAVCCREWDMAVGFPPGRCGICHTVPVPVGPSGSAGVY